MGESADDADEYSWGLIDLTSPFIYIGEFGNRIYAGFRFPGVTGLSGQTIDAAILRFHAGATDSASFEGDFRAHDAEAPGVFTSSDSDISTRPLTTKTCEADGSDFGSWSAGNWYEFDGAGSDTNTIKDIIQELADSYDPSAIVIIHELASGTGERLPHAWDYDTSLAAKLDIDYEPAGGAGVTVVAALATATALSYAPTITTGLLVSAAIATATALALTAKHVNTIPAAVATATAKSYEATITTAALIAGALATATAKSYAATASGVALIAGALATATAKSYDAVVTGAANVSAALATATAKSYAATIISGDRIVQAAVATASALAHVAKHINVIPAAVSTATAASLAATASGAATIAGALATATARSWDATVSSATLIAGAVSTATARSWAAVINPGVTIAGVLATATALAPKVTLVIDGVVGAVRRLAYYPVSLVSTRFRRRGRR